MIITKILKQMFVHLFCLSISLLIAFFTYISYMYSNDWNFFIAFIGGAIDIGTIYSLYDKFYK